MSLIIGYSSCARVPWNWYLFCVHLWWMNQFDSGEQCYIDFHVKHACKTFTIVVISAYVLKFIVQFNNNQNIFITIRVEFRWVGHKPRDIGNRTWNSRYMPWTAYTLRGIVGNNNSTHGINWRQQTIYSIWERKRENAER